MTFWRQGSAFLAKAGAHPVIFPFLALVVSTKIGEETRGGGLGNIPLNMEGRTWDIAVDDHEFLILLPLPPQCSKSWDYVTSPT